MVGKGALLYTTAPALAVFAKYNLLNELNGKTLEQVHELDWVGKWEETGLLSFEDKDGNGTFSFTDKKDTTEITIDRDIIGASRYLSFITIGICAAGIAAHFVIPYFQIYQQPWAGIAQFLIRTWDGMFTPFLASFVFLNTMMQKYGRVMVIDGVHMVLILGFLGLWVSTL